MPMLKPLIYGLTLLCLVIPLGAYMSWVFNHPNHQKLPKTIHRWCGINPHQNMHWTQYAQSMLWFNGLGVLLTYGILRLQCWLPFNPQHLATPTPFVSLITSMGFVTNTDWQSVGFEQTFGYGVQMLGLITQNFLSAATGLSVLMAFTRGLVGEQQDHLGNFWVDITRGILYVLLPLAFIFAIILVSLGVVQSLNANTIITPLQTSTDNIIPQGPVASQVAISQLGTNGGGFFNVNAAHPLANPTPLTNFLEMIAILLIPMSLCYTFGRMVSDERQGFMMLITMIILFGLFFSSAMYFEQQDNLEGKETRFGIADSVLWSIATTASGSGSTNVNLDSLTPMAKGFALWLMQLGEVVFGGVGTGLLGMLMLVIMTVFLAGLMVGRTPEYLGKKIEPFEMKMACIAILMMPVLVLITTASTVIVTPTNTHEFFAILYAWTSMTANNGSALTGFETNTMYYSITGCILMFWGRFGTIIPMLAMAGALAQKKKRPINAGTLSTHSTLFIGLLTTTILIISALAFLPAQALGPIALQLLLGVSHG